MNKERKKIWKTKLKLIIIAIIYLENKIGRNIYYTILMN